MGKIVGNKEKIAIEYSITHRTPHLLGKICLWLKNMRIGYYETENLIGVTTQQLINLNNRIHDLTINENLIKCDDDTILDKMESGKYFLSPGESFDDYSIRVFNNNDYLHFIWKLHKKTFFKYSENERGIKHTKLLIKDYNAFIDTLQTVKW